MAAPPVRAVAAVARWCESRLRQIMDEEGSVWFVFITESAARSPKHRQIRWAAAGSIPIPRESPGAFGTDPRHHQRDGNALHRVYAARFALRLRLAGRSACQSSHCAAGAIKTLGRSDESLANRHRRRLCSWSQRHSQARRPQFGCEWAQSVVVDCARRDVHGHRRTAAFAQKLPGRSAKESPRWIPAKACWLTRSLAFR